ncbi:hypothetical protein EH221_04480 [bacterium]|nr:MAG: hypothetical protein EH221_04480 [bacterium]
MKKRIPLVLIAAILMCPTLVNSASHYFTDGAIPEGAEFTLGIFDHEGNFLGDANTFPLRFEMGFSGKMSGFIQAEWLKLDTIVGDISTFGFGLGGMYQIVEDGKSLPFDISVRGSAMHYLEKEKTMGIIRLIMDSYTDIQVSGIASKTFKDLGAFDITPYSSLNVAFVVSDDTDTAFTFALGGRFRFAQSWSLFAEYDLGDRDGWGFGGSYSF